MDVLPDLFKYANVNQLEEYAGIIPRHDFKIELNEMKFDGLSNRNRIPLSALMPFPYAIVPKNLYAIDSLRREVKVKAEFAQAVRQKTIISKLWNNVHYLERIKFSDPIEYQKLKDKPHYKHVFKYHWGRICWIDTNEEITEQNLIDYLYHARRSQSVRYSVPKIDTDDDTWMEY